MTAPRPRRLVRKSRLQRQAVEARSQRRIDELEARRASRPPRRSAGRQALPPAVEELLQARARGRCELCGQPLRDRCQRHHRKLRSQGGLDDVANLVLLHPNCHNTVHANPLWAQDHGWIVKSRRNPATVPITLHDVRPVLLTRDGNYESVAA